MQLRGKVRSVLKRASFAELAVSRRLRDVSCDSCRSWACPWVATLALALALALGLVALVAIAGVVFRLPG